MSPSPRCPWPSGAGADRRHQHRALQGPRIPPPHGGSAPPSPPPRSAPRDAAHRSAPLLPDGALPAPPRLNTYLPLRSAPRPAGRGRAGGRSPPLPCAPLRAAPPRPARCRSRCAPLAAALPWLLRSPARRGRAERSQALDKAPNRLLLSSLYDINALQYISL